MTLASLGQLKHTRNQLSWRVSWCSWGRSEAILIPC